MKTTVELQDALLRKVKARAAARGRTLKQYFNEALIEKLARDDAKGTGEPGWMKAFGTVPRSVTDKINAIIEEEFEVVDPEDWK